MVKLRLRASDKVERSSIYLNRDLKRQVQNQLWQVTPEPTLPLLMNVLLRKWVDGEIPIDPDDYKEFLR